MAYKGGCKKTGKAECAVTLSGALHIEKRGDFVCQKNESGDRWYVLVLCEFVSTRPVLPEFIDSIIILEDTVEIVRHVMDLRTYDFLKVLTFMYDDDCRGVTDEMMMEI